MPKYAVGIANFFDNDLKVSVVEAESFRKACIKTRLAETKYLEDDTTWLKDLPNTEEEIKTFFFDVDMLIGWIELEIEENN